MFRIIVISVIAFLFLKKTKVKTGRAITPGSNVMTNKNNVQTWYEANGSFYKNTVIEKAGTKLGKVIEVYTEYTAGAGASAKENERVFLKIDWINKNQFVKEIYVNKNDCSLSQISGIQKNNLNGIFN